MAANGSRGVDLEVDVFMVYGHSAIPKAGCSPVSYNRMAR